MALSHLMAANDPVNQLGAFENPFDNPSRTQFGIQANLGSEHAQFDPDSSPGQLRGSRPQSAPPPLVRAEEVRGTAAELLSRRSSNLRGTLAKEDGADDAVHEEASQSESELDPEERTTLLEHMSDYVQRDMYPMKQHIRTLENKVAQLLHEHAPHQALYKRQKYQMST